MERFGQLAPFRKIAGSKSSADALGTPIISIAVHERTAKKPRLRLPGCGQRKFGKRNDTVRNDGRGDSFIHQKSRRDTMKAWEVPCVLLKASLYWRIILSKCATMRFGAAGTRFETDYRRTALGARAPEGHSRGPGECQSFNRPPAFHDSSQRHHRVRRTADAPRTRSGSAA